MMLSRSRWPRAGRAVPAGRVASRRTALPPAGPARTVRRVALPVALACCYLLVCRWPAASQERPADERPNVVVILADDLGYRDVSFQGAADIETPHLDRLAQTGVIFSNGYVAHPLCSPSRAALMTGRYPARFGMESNLSWTPFDEQHGLSLQERTVAGYLREAGYRTAIIGKWHLGAAPVFHPLNRGFDHFYGFAGGGHDYFRFYHRVDSTAAPLHEYVLPLDDGSGAAGFSGYLTDALTDRALEFVAAPRDEPFFLYLSYNAPHTPLQAPAETVRKYRHVADGNRRSYLAMIDSLDRNVGRITAALQEAGRRENTLIFFLSDNGGASGARENWADNGPLRAGKGSLFDGGIRVPFAASWPARWPGGTTFEPMVISLDIAATALAAAGAHAAADRPLDGVNLDPFVRGAAAGVPHQALFWATNASRNRNAGYAVRTADTKLVNDRLEAGPALFDLRADPGETRDLLARQPATAARLTALWNDWNERNANERNSNERYSTLTGAAIATGTAARAVLLFLPMICLGYALVRYRPGFLRANRTVLTDALVFAAVYALFLAMFLPLADTNLEDGAIYRIDAAEQAELAAPAGTRLADAEFDLHLLGRTLEYFKEPCAEEDLTARFFLHVFPAEAADLSVRAKEFQVGYDRLNFWFEDRGALDDGRCAAVVTLPDYRIGHLTSGQYVPGEGQLWQVEITGHQLRLAADRESVSPR